MKPYILLYGDKKPEDNICLKNMFKNNHPINVGWSDFDYNHNIKIIEEKIKEGIEQIILAGFEIGWDKMVETIKKGYPDIIIKVICNTQDSLLYYEYERQNFFRLLELSRENVIQDIAFLRKGQYETYKNLGYNCSYLNENYILPENKKITKTQNKMIELGIYPLNYTWDKNIFNQLCIAKFIENCHLNYNSLDPRMEEFLNTMEICSSPDKIEKIDDDAIIEKIVKNDVIVSTSFTEYVHPIFWISMELGIPCLIGNNSDFFEQEELKQYIVTSAEDNPIINAQMVEKILEKMEKSQELYKIWKQDYNKKAEHKLEEFLNK